MNHIVHIMKHFDIDRQGKPYRLIPETLPGKRARHLQTLQDW